VTGRSLCKRAQARAGTYGCVPACVSRTIRAWGSSAARAA